MTEPIMAALEEVEVAARAIIKWDSFLVKELIPERLMSALDQALTKVDRAREQE